MFTKTRLPDGVLKDWNTKISMGKEMLLPPLPLLWSRAHVYTNTHSHTHARACAHCAVLNPIFKSAGSCGWSLPKECALFGFPARGLQPSLLACRLLSVSFLLSLHGSPFLISTDRLKPYDSEAASHRMHYLISFQTTKVFPCKQLEWNLVMLLKWEISKEAKENLNKN